jgi:hypothetical protein
MSADFFTRADWRPSKHRKMQKRIKPWGGRKTAPPELIEAGKRVQFGSGVHRICHATKRNGQPCGNIALSGLTVCGPHGGFGAWATQGKLQPTGRSAAVRAARAAMIEDRTPNPPTELINLPIYQQTDQWSRMRLAKAWGTQSWHRLISQLKQRQAVTSPCV